MAALRVPTMRVQVLAPPLASAGGIQRYTRTLVQALNDLLCDGSVHCLAMPEVLPGNGRDRQSTRSKLSFCFHALQDAVRWKPDLIICAHLALGPVAWLASKIWHRPYWIFVYGVEAWVSLPFAKRTALRRAARVVAVSEFTREQVMNRQQVKAGHIAHLPCALDEGLMTVAPANTGPHQLVAERSAVILTVARMAAGEQYKGHDVILRALPCVLSRVPDLVYVVVGEGDDRARIEALADTLGIRHKVIFTGRVSDSELVALYHRADIFVLPAQTAISRSEAKGEGFGIVFIEAMAFGKPVIGPSDGAPAEIIRHGRHGLLVNPLDSSAIAEALVDLLTNPDKACAMGQAGSDWVRQHYSYASFRERLKEILDDPAHAH